MKRHPIDGKKDGKKVRKYDCWQEREDRCIDELKDG